MINARELYRLPPAVRLSYQARCERQLESLRALRLELKTTYDYDRLRGVTVSVRGLWLHEHVCALKRAS